MNSAFKIFIPTEYHPLLACISTDAFKVVDWKSLIKEAPIISRRLLQKQGVSELSTSLSLILPQGLRIGNSENLTKLATGHTFGEKLLELYFRQIRNPQGLFLDLRPGTFFELNDTDFIWQPNGFWVRWSDEFRTGILNIYDGYYKSKPELMRRGLLQVGLVRPEFSDEESKRVEDMLLSHIGGNAEGLIFQLEHFTKSFDKVFEFLLRNKMTLSSDFLYLGVYLASLYLHMEKLGGMYNVRAAYDAAQTGGPRSSKL